MNVSLDYIFFIPWFLGLGRGSMFHILFDILLERDMSVKCELVCTLGLLSVVEYDGYIWSTYVRMSSYVLECQVVMPSHFTPLIFEKFKNRTHLSSSMYRHLYPSIESYIYLLLSSTFFFSDLVVVLFCDSCNHFFVHPSKFRQSLVRIVLILVETWLKLHSNATLILMCWRFLWSHWKDDRRRKSSVV